MINNNDDVKGIIGEIESDLKNMKFNECYTKEERKRISQALNVLKSAKENQKQYLRPQHFEKLMDHYQDLIKEMIILTENRFDKKYYERCIIIAGLYALISYLESPLYYLENTDLCSFQVEDLTNICESVAALPIEQLSVMCPLITLPSVYQPIAECAKERNVPVREEVMAYSKILQHKIQTYQSINLDEVDPSVQWEMEEVQSLLHITSEHGYTFALSGGQSQLSTYNKDDMKEAFNLIYGSLYKYNKYVEERQLTK